MYLNTKRHYLSNSICISAIIGLLSQVLGAFSRVAFSSGKSEPDMLNGIIFNFQIMLQIVVIAAIALVFFYNIKNMRHSLSLVSDEDAEEMALLQKQYIPDSISTLKAETINGLLEIWAAILIFIQIMSIISNYQYKSFVSDLYSVIPMDTYENALTFSGIYNSTHGFKYIGMFSALIIGIFSSAVFLKDRILKIVSAVLTIAFLLSFTIFQMITFDAHIKIISIVWTSVIYHSLETVGLILFSVYISKHYKGL